MVQSTDMLNVPMGIGQGCSGMVIVGIYYRKSEPATIVSIRSVFGLSDLIYSADTSSHLNIY